MDLDHPTAGLAQHDPDPGAVLAALHVKRRRHARNRGLVLGGVAGAAVVIVLVVAVLRPWATPSRSPATAEPDASAQTAVANGCASISLPQTLAMARQGGASLIIATGTLTGKTVTDGQIYHEMTLESVQTLSGPAVTSGGTGWIAAQRGPAGPIPGADAGALWALDGRLFAIAWSAQVTGTAVGPVLRVAPVVRDQVVLSTAGCWDATGLPAAPYQGSLAEIPGSDSYARAAPNGFHAIPLTTVEHLAAG